MIDPDDRIVQFDGIRALAFLAVFMHHALNLPLGWLGVDMFFVLSGFLITGILLRLRSSPAGTALRRFYLRRLLRIVPPYYIVLSLIYLTHPALRPGGAWFYGFASNVLDGVGPQWLGLSGEWGGGPLRAMWSIALEAQFYLLWPWLVLFLPRRLLPGLFMALIVAAPLFRVLFQSVGRDAVYRLTPCRMDLLAAGALASHLDDAYPRWMAAHRRRIALAAVLAASLFLGLTVADRDFRSAANRTLFNVAGYGLSTALFTAVLMYTRVAQGGMVGRALRLPALGYVGRISYTAYLIHLFFLEVFRQWCGYGRSLSALMGLAATLSFASASWFAVERPLLRLPVRATGTQRPE